ncbi:MAG TPA: hypothetical protein DCZ34_02150 [Clostridiales bacterium]|nr:hypothetical protein [Clostridiales bacterium]
MAEKQVYTYPDGSTLVYYQQNINKCTDVNIGFRIPTIDIPTEDKTIGTYKNLVFYMSNDPQNPEIKIPLVKPGIPHFVEHMFYSPIKGMTAQEMAKEFTKTNTRHNAATTQHYVKTEFNCPSKFIEKIFSMESKMIFRNGYDHDYLEAEKKPVFQELELTLDEEKCGKSCFDIIMNNYATLIGSEILGIDKKIIDTFTESQLVKFGKTYFTKQNLVMTVVSDLPFEKIKSLCDKYIVSKAPSVPETKMGIPTMVYECKQDFQVLVKNEAQNTATIDFILQGTKNAEKNDLFSNIEDFILSDMNGRLYTKFRTEGGYAYTPIFSTVDLPQQPFKLFQVQTTKENVKICIQQLTSILDDLIKNGITDEEFQGFKEMWENRRERKTSIKHNSASILFDKVIYGEPIFVHDFYQKTKNITKEEINQYLRDIYSNSKLNMFVTGNFNKEDILPLEEILVKYRPYDKYVDKHMKDKLAISDFYCYLAQLASDPKKKASAISIVSVPTPEDEQDNEEQPEQEQYAKRNKTAKDKSDKKSKNTVESNNEDDELTL